MDLGLLSEKQTLLLNAVSKFGIITKKQIERYLKNELKHSTLYKVRNQLMDMGLIAVEKAGYNTVFYITEKGARHTGDTTIGYTSFPAVTLNHDLMVNECILTYLEIAKARGQNVDFVSEKTLLKYELENAIFLTSEEKVKKNSVKLRNRIPDFVLLVRNADTNGNEHTMSFAYEVELHAKSKARYDDKFAHYKQLIERDHYYSNVTYIVADNVVKNAVVRASSDKLKVNEQIHFKMLNEVVKIEQ
ncbi:replication-relaxation family protein [Bacillus toyonensis]